MSQKATGLQAHTATQPYRDRHLLVLERSLSSRIHAVQQQEQLLDQEASDARLLGKSPSLFCGLSLLRHDPQRLCLLGFGGAFFDGRSTGSFDSLLDKTTCNAFSDDC